LRKAFPTGEHTPLQGPTLQFGKSFSLHGFLARSAVTSKGVEAEFQKGVDCDFGGMFWRGMVTGRFLQGNARAQASATCACSDAGRFT
jgi:hypothetical protein